MLGYGWAGIFRKFLVDSPYMWWPSNLIQVSLFRYYHIHIDCISNIDNTLFYWRLIGIYSWTDFRTLHEKEKRKRGGNTRLQFFLMVFALSFGYYIVPAYLFPSLSTMSFLCWIAKDSVTVQQIGSGVSGLGIGSFGLDWNTVAGFLGTPLATPGFAILNVMTGFFLIVYVLNPIVYWTNTFEAKKFPIFSSDTFDSQGQVYNLSRILNNKEFDINMAAYKSYSRINMSSFFAISYGLSFATLAATIMHILIFHGK